MKLMVFSSDAKKLKPAAIKLREQGHVALICDSTKFHPEDIVTDIDGIVLLDPSEMVEAVYESYNGRAEKDKQVSIEKRFDFDASKYDEKTLAEMEGRPIWKEMTVKELIEYAAHNYGVKLLGSKAEIITKIDLLWKEARAAVPQDPEKAVDPKA